MTETLFRRTAAEQGWTDATQIAVLLRYAAQASSLATLRDFLVQECASPSGDDPSERFMHEVIAVLRDPGLAIDRAFRLYCANSRDLLTPRQAAERWCCWRAA